jgi:Gluconate 2-dehydrogenase subunit 3
MSHFLDDRQRGILEAACSRLVPADDEPDAAAVGAADYIEGLLGAFLVDPPRIWAGGAFSGRFGGSPSFASFHRLAAQDELAWRTRIEGSRGIPERERLGPVAGLQKEYTEGLAALGEDFPTLAPEQQDVRLRSVGPFLHLLYEHVCEGLYAAPEYGGNRDLLGWRSIGYLGDVQPRGYSDEEVSGE